MVVGNMKERQRSILMEQLQNGRAGNLATMVRGCFAVELELIASVLAVPVANPPVVALAPPSLQHWPSWNVIEGINQGALHWRFLVF